MTDIRRLPGPGADNWDWQRRGSCRGVDSSLFFAPHGERGSARTRREAQAKRFCARCPVLQQCREHALTVHEPYGVWGGLSETERAHVHRLARRTLVVARFPRQEGTRHEDSPRQGP